MTTKKIKAPKSKAPAVKLDTSPEKQPKTVRGRLTHTKDSYVILLDQDPENLWRLVQAYRDGAGTDLAQHDSYVALAFTANLYDISQLAIEAQPRTVGAQKVIDDNKMQELLDKHKQMEVAVQDLLVELKIGPEDLRRISRHDCRDNDVVSPKTAQKLLDVGIAPPTGKPEKIPCCPLCSAEGLGDRDGKHHCSDPDCMLHLARFSPDDWAKHACRPDMDQYKEMMKRRPIQPRRDCQHCGADWDQDDDGMVYCCDPACDLHTKRFTVYEWDALVPNKTKRGPNKTKPDMDQYKKSVTPEARERVLNKLEEDPSYYRASLVADESCIWHGSRKTFHPIATFKNQNGDVLQIVQDEGQFVVVRQDRDGSYKPIGRIPREVVQYLNTLPW